MQVYQETDQATTQQAENPVPFIGTRGFTQVENTVIYNRDLSVGARHTYTVLTAHMYNKDHCWPGMARLAHILGVTEKTARGYIRELEDAGLIHKRRQGQGYTNVYTRKSAFLNHESKPVNTTDQEKHISTGPDQALITAKEDEVEEKKYKNPPGGASAPQTGESKDKDQVPSKTSTLSANGENQRHEAARQLAEQLSVDLETVGVLLDGDQLEKYRINFRRLIDKGVNAGELDKTVDRIVERWSDYQLSPQQALQDVRGGMGDKANPTPPPGVKALRAYHNAKTGKTDLRAYAGLAEQWNFTSEEEPPRRIFNQLGGATPDTRGYAADEERRRNFKRIHNVTSRAVEEDADRRRRAMGMDIEGSATPTESASPALEEAPEGSSTREAAEGNADDEHCALVEAVERLQADPDSKAARLARAVVAGKKSGNKPITSKEVSVACREEIDMEALGFDADLSKPMAKAAATILIRKFWDQANEKASA